MMQSSDTDPEFGQPAALGGRAVNDHLRSCTVPGVPEKAPTRALSLLKAFTIKSLL